MKCCDNHIENNKNKKHNTRKSQELHIWYISVQLNYQKPKEKELKK